MPWVRTPVRPADNSKEVLICHEKGWWFAVHNNHKSALVYALHILEYVLGLVRFRVVVPKLLLLCDIFKLKGSKLYWKENTIIELSNKHNRNEEIKKKECSQDQNLFLTIEVRFTKSLYLLLRNLKAGCAPGFLEQTFIRN